MDRKKIKNINFFINNVFLFESSTCICELIITKENSITKESIKISNTNNKLKYAYAPKIGLVLLDSEGKIQENNILGKLITIKKDNLLEYIRFFEKFGFIFPIKNEFEIFSSDALLSIIKRLRATVELFSTITDISRTSYEKITRLIFYHLFAPIYKFNAYAETKHPYTIFHENAQSLKIDKKFYDTFNNNEFIINDTIKKDYIIKNELVTSLRNNDFDEPNINNDLFKNCLRIYLAPQEDVTNNNKIINDFLFHNLMEIGQIKSISIDSIEYFEKPNKENFDSRMKNQSVNIGRFIIKHELENNLKKIKPTYDINKLEPSWKIDSLLSALYFGLFYMNPKMEIYRQCACKSCGNYFIVSVTSKKKKYCSKECQNRDMQARYRANHK